LINRLLSLFHRPENGWDPVPAEYAKRYGEVEWSTLNVGLVDQLERWIGGFKGKRVLDLGAGPGQYSVAFARRGAQVTWYDVSRNYQLIAQKRSAEAGVSLEFSLGYLEDAKRYVHNPFDLVFIRLAWYYCMNDLCFNKEDPIV